MEPKDATSCLELASVRLLDPNGRVEASIVVVSETGPGGNVREDQWTNFQSLVQVNTVCHRYLCFAARGRHVFGSPVATGRCPATLFAQKPKVAFTAAHTPTIGRDAWRTRVSGNKLIVRAVPIRVAINFLVSEWQLSASPFR